MQKRLYQFLPLLILLGGVTAAGLAQSPIPDGSDPPANSSKPSLMNRLLSGSQKKNEEKQDSATSKGKQPGGMPGVKQADVADQLHTQARNAWVRRDEVCLKLLEIARQLSGSDNERSEKLERLAAQLEQLAWDAYTRRTGTQAAGTAAPLADENLMQSQLATSPVPSAGQSGGSTAGAGSGTSYTIRGDNP